MKGREERKGNRKVKERIRGGVLLKKRNERRLENNRKKARERVEKRREGKVVKERRMRKKFDE